MSPADEAPKPADSASPAELIVVPTRQLVFFPGVVFPVNVNRPAAIAAAQQAVREQQQVLLVLQRDQAKEDVGTADLYEMGVVANILRYITAPDGAHHIICQGVARFKVSAYRADGAFLTARGELVEESAETTPDIEARFLVLRQQVNEVMDLLPQTPPELKETIQAVAAPGALADLAAAYLDAKPEEKQAILETVEIAPRLTRITELLAHRLQVLRLSEEINKQTRGALEERQREMLLREQMASIQKELGEDEGSRAAIEELEAAIEKAQMPDEVARHRPQGVAPAAAHAGFLA